MTEFTTIQIARFRDPQGDPTCCRHAEKQECQFLTSRKFGTVEVCQMTGCDLARVNQWLRPTKECPVWK